MSWFMSILYVVICVCVGIVVRVVGWLVVVGFLVVVLCFGSW